MGAVMVAAPDATIHHLAASKHRRGGVRMSTPGELDMPDAEAKLDRLVNMVTDVRVDLVGIDGKLERLVSDTADHEKRLRALEAFRWKAAGIGTVIGAGASFFVQRLFG